MLDKSSHQQNKPRDIHNRSEDKTNNKEERAESESYINEETNIKIDNFITCFLLSSRECIIFEEEIDCHQEDAESTDREEIADEMEDTNHFDS